MEPMRTPDCSAPWLGHIQVSLLLVDIVSTLLGFSHIVTQHGIFFFENLPFMSNVLKFLPCFSCFVHLGTSFKK